EPPPSRVLLDLRRQMTSFGKALQLQDIFQNISAPHEEIDFIASAFAESGAKNPLQRANYALTAFYKRDAVEQEEMIEQDTTSEEEMHIFSPLRKNQTLQNDLLIDNVENFSRPLVDKFKMLEQAAVVERLSGRTNRNAVEIAAEVVKDIQIVTLYPPDDIDQLSADDITNDIQALIRRLEAERERKNET
ncbi:MAG: hypothetical protein ACNA7Y_03060, partial [Gammaproteobacteria bacterium]